MAMGAPDNALGEFLRARRARVRPEDVGLHVHGRRRVPGLRREELAQLAGISADAYARLERGRDRHPSPVVLDALARALKLDEEATAHLNRLARAALPGRRIGGRRFEPVRPAAARLLATWTEQPAFVLGRHLDVLAANTLAELLHPGFAPGTNLARFVFLDERARDRYVDWEGVAAEVAAALRGSSGSERDPALADLVGELSLKSIPFRRLWAHPEVRAKSSDRTGFVHPHVGVITLDHESVPVAAAPEQTLVVLTAEPGSPDERALRELAALAPGDDGRSASAAGRRD